MMMKAKKGSKMFVTVANTFGKLQKFFLVGIVTPIVIVIETAVIIMAVVATVEAGVALVAADLAAVPAMVVVQVEVGSSF